MAWKYPGRVGDSPIIGAGNYCDNRYGAVACTGMGELAIRVSTARSLVLYLRFGLSLREAGMAALQDLEDLRPPSAYRMSIVALTPGGEHMGFTAMAERRIYLYMTGDMDAPAQAERIGRPTP
jgi:beta-aspartyl-peptidase (threonine type)